MDVNEAKLEKCENCGLWQPVPCDLYPCIIARLHAELEAHCSECEFRSWKWRAKMMDILRDIDEAKKGER